MGKVRLKDRRGYNRRSPVVTFSPEVIAHLNFLQKSQGEEAAQRYLNEIKSKQNGGAEEMAQETKVVQHGGTFEAALREAQERVAYHRKEAQSHAQQAEVWEKAVEQLRDTLDMIAGKKLAKATQKVTTTESEVRKGFWKEMIPSIMKEFGRPVTRAELRKRLEEEVGDRENSPRVYQAVKIAERHGVLHEIDGKLVLESWTAPEKKEAIA